jgi:hypothetical protein
MVVVVVGAVLVVVVGGDVLVEVATVVLVEVVTVVLVAGTLVVVVGVHVGLGFFFTVVVVTGRRTGVLGFGRRVLTVSVIVACHLTRVPAAGDWCRTTIHFPFALPGPRVLKNSCTRFMTA